MSATWVYVDDRGYDYWRRPVLTLLLVRDTAPDGQVTDAVLPGVLDVGSQTVVPAADLLPDAVQVGFVGVYPEGVMPPQADLDLAWAALRQRLSDAWSEAERLPSPQREARRQQISAWVASVPGQRLEAAA
jgi:hypothetical protein